MLVASLPLPPSANNLYYNDPRGGRRLTREGREYKYHVMQMLMLEGARAKCPELPLELTLWVLVPDRRHRDNSNMVKAVEDALSTLLGYNDSHHHILHVYKGMDRHDPRCVIQLEHKSERIPEPPDRKERRLCTA